MPFHSTPLNSDPNRLTVLLVEDDLFIRNLMGMLLSGAGFEVIQTINGEEALELVEFDPQKPIHLLITDMVMPRMGGNELASRLKTVHPKMRILFCSGHPQRNIFPVNSAESTIPFLSKPFSSTTLLETVNAVLTGVQ